MAKNMNLSIIFCALCIVLDTPKVEMKRPPFSTSRPFKQETTPQTTAPKYSEEFKSQRQTPPYYSEELKSPRTKPPMYSEELKPTRVQHSDGSKLTSTKRPTYSEESRSTRTQPPMYSEELKPTRAKHSDGSKLSSTKRPTYSEESRSTRPQPPIFSEELKPSKTKLSTFSEEFQSTTPRNYGSRRRSPKPKPMCGTDCNRPPTKKRKTAMPPSQSNHQKAMNETERPKYSYQYGNPNADGFVPVPGPYGSSSVRTARSKSIEELTAKESRQSPNILGNGNFEILSGGVYSEDETNEIPQGRRVGRTFENFRRHHPRFQPIPYNVQNFQFPAFYPNRHQFPAHPLFLPRGAF